MHFMGFTAKIKAYRPHVHTLCLQAGLRQKLGIRVQFELVFDGLEKQERKFYKSLLFQEH